MSNIAIDPSLGSQASKGPEAAQGKAAEHKGAPQVDVMALAYYYLVQAATTTSESALVQAKQTKANGLAQQELNKEAAALQWYYVPNLKSTKHKTYIPHSHWNWNPFKHGGIGWYTTYQKITWTTHKNQVTVTNDQSKNEQIAAERQTLTQKMGVLQQIASISETHINTISDESTQTMQESSQLLQIIQSLTFQALLRRQPQG